MDTGTNLLAHQNIKENRLKASKTIWTKQRLCYAQLNQATETLLGPATNNKEQATKCGLIKHFIVPSHSELFSALMDT